MLQATLQWLQENMMQRITRQTPLNMSLTQPTFSKNTLQSLHNSAPTSMTKTSHNFSRNKKTFVYFLMVF